MNTHTHTHLTAKMKQLFNEQEEELEKKQQVINNGEITHVK